MIKSKPYVDDEELVEIAASVVSKPTPSTEELSSLTNDSVCLLQSNTSPSHSDHFFQYFHKAMIIDYDASTIPQSSPAITTSFSGNGDTGSLVNSKEVRKVSFIPFTLS